MSFEMEGVSMKLYVVDQVRGQKLRIGMDQEEQFFQKGRNERVNFRIYGYSFIWCWLREVRVVRVVE